ncbi:MAG: PKD domain-containing protein [Candidatus Niyogibacteria bacterium]|nr:PKD domain-containing protein [Candidatus Niyogibacteria bacterium]
MNPVRSKKSSISARLPLAARGTSNGVKYALIFVLMAVPALVSAAVRINEVAWMGTANSASDEWVEPYSDSAENLSGWALGTADGGMNVALSGAIGAGGYFLIERTDDSTVPNISADLIAAFGNGLSNDGEILFLKNVSGAEIDRVDASGGWPAGDKTTKETMQRLGSNWLTAAGTPKTANAGGNEHGEDVQSPNTPSAVSMPPDNAPRMSVDAGDDRAVVVGASIRFDGILYDGAGSPVAGADFLWSFGDGATARGASVFHSYRFPGDYTVFLSVAFGATSMTDRLTARVMANSLLISELKPADGGWIEIANTSAYALDISGWGISNGQFTYSVPAHTEIRTGARLIISSDLMNMDFPLSGMAYLLYPNGSPAHEFSYAGALKSDESFHERDGIVKIGMESPGSDRFVFRSPSAVNSKIQTQTTAPAGEPVKETAAVRMADDEGRSFPWNSVLWIAAALGIGIAGAAGYMILRFRGIL